MPDQPIDVRKWFIDQPEPPEHTYELALVLGAPYRPVLYRGRSDFLIEALDSWYAAKAQKRPAGAHARAGVSRHRRHLRRRRQRRDHGQSPRLPIPSGRARDIAFFGRDRDYPFYDTWVNQIGLFGFLDTSDLRNGKVRSVLNGAPLDNAARHIALCGRVHHRDW